MPVNLITNVNDALLDSCSRKDTSRRDECRENGEIVWYVRFFDFLLSSFPSFSSRVFYLCLFLSFFCSLREWETFRSHKAFTTRIQLTWKASRNFTKRDSTLTLMLPVENCKNCLRRFFLLNNSLYEDRFNPIHSFVLLLHFSVLHSHGQESIGRVKLLCQNRETVSKPTFIRK